MGAVQRWAPLLVVLGLMVAFFVGLGLKPSEIPSALIDQPAPAFSLPALHDAQQTITQDTLSEQVSLLNVWASWCVACRVEHPLLVELAGRKLLPIYGLNYKDQPADSRRWLQRHGDPYTASAVDLDGRVGIDYGVYGAPETFLIDSAGMIRYKHIGPLTREALDEILLPMIAELQAGDGA